MPARSASIIHININHRHHPHTFHRPPFTIHNPPSTPTSTVHHPPSITDIPRQPPHVGHPYPSYSHSHQPFTVTPTTDARAHSRAHTQKEHCAHVVLCLPLCACTIRSATRVGNSASAMGASGSIFAVKSTVALLSLRAMAYGGHICGSSVTTWSTLSRSGTWSPR